MPPCLSGGPREAGGTGVQAWGAVGNTAKSTFSTCSVESVKNRLRRPIGCAKGDTRG